MTIETKYNIGDEVWFDVNFNPNFGEIRRIEIIVFEDKGYIPRYTIEHDGSITKEFEHDIYPTKEELLKSL